MRQGHSLSDTHLSKMDLYALMLAHSAHTFKHLELNQLAQETLKYPYLALLPQVITIHGTEDTQVRG